MPSEHFYGRMMSFAQRGATLLTIWREPVLKPDHIWRRDLNRCTNVPHTPWIIQPKLQSLPYKVAIVFLVFLFGLRSFELGFLHMQ